MMVVVVNSTVDSTNLERGSSFGERRDSIAEGYAPSTVCGCSTGRCTGSVWGHAGLLPGTA